MSRLVRLVRLVSKVLAVKRLVQKQGVKGKPSRREEGVKDKGSQEHSQRGPGLGLYQRDS